MRKILRIKRGSEKKSWPPRWTNGLAEQQQEGVMVLVVMCLSSMVARLQTAGKASRDGWGGMKNGRGDGGITCLDGPSAVP